MRSATRAIDDWIELLSAQHSKVDDPPRSPQPDSYPVGKGDRISTTIFEALMKDLVQIIKDNPGCTAIIDNDCWQLVKTNDPPEDSKNWTFEEEDEWYEAQKLASSNDDIVERGSGYGSGNCYGGDILQALAEIVGLKIESA